MYSILVCDDEKDIVSALKIYLMADGYQVFEAYNGKEALEVLKSHDIHLVLMDIMMPEMDGISAMVKIRETSNVPVLMLTAKSDEEDKVSGLRLGADDYLTKPFSLNELMARVNSLIRRFTTLNPTSTINPDILTLKDMVIDKENRIVSINAVPVDLTGKEFDLLYFLASNKGRVFTKKQIYTQVWEEEYAFDDNNIMSFISKLRKKVEPDPDHPFYILTVRGVGYRFNMEA